MSLTMRVERRKITLRIVDPEGTVLHIVGCSLLFNQLLLELLVPPLLLKKERPVNHSWGLFVSISSKLRQLPVLDIKTE